MANAPSNEAVKLLYAFVGEPTLVAEAVANVRGKVLTKASDFNRDEFRAGQTPIDRVVQAASTLPMMAPRRYVHLSDIHELKAEAGQQLMAYLEKPSPTTVLVISGAKVDQRTKFGSALSKLAGLQSLEPPKQNELGGWLIQRASKRGLKLERDAAQLLGDLLGAEVGNLDRALDKVALHAGDGQVLTIDDVEATVAPTRVHSIFELTDAIGARDLGKASSLVRNALNGGESALLVLTMVARQFRLILQVKSLKTRGANNKEIAESTGARPFLIDSLVGQARRYSEGELQAALESALDADARLKSTRLDPGVVLDRLLVDVMKATQASKPNHA